MATEIATPTYCGWHRQRRKDKWVLLARADTEEGAWAALLDLSPRGADLLVTPTGRDPNRRGPPNR